MAAFKISQTVDMNSAGKPDIKQAYGHLGDKLAHEWAVTVVRNSAPVDLTGYTAMAIVNNGAGSVEIVGSITGNVASALFPAACYAYEGTHACLMRITSGDATAETIMAGMYLNVAEGESDVIIDPGTDIATTLSGLLATEAARVAAEEDRAEAEVARQAAAAEVLAASGYIDQLGDLMDEIQFNKAASGVHLSLFDGIAGLVAKITVAGTVGATAALTVCGKNVYDPTIMPSQNYASTYAVADGIIHYVNADGGTRNVVVKCYALKPGKAYAVSTANVSGTNMVVTLTQKTAAGATVGTATTMYETSTPKVFVTDATMNYVEVSFTSPSTTTICDYYCSLQVEEGSAATAYAAYAGSTAIVNCNEEVERTATVPMHIFVAGMGNVISANYRVAPTVDIDGQDDAAITCWGDSLTLGSGGTSVYYPSQLATLTGRTVNNRGIAGESSLTIAARQGGFPFLVQPFTIPQAANSVAVTLKSSYLDGTVAPLVGGGTPGINPCYINGIKGTLSLSGGVYYFTRTTQGNATVPVTRPTPIITDAMLNNRRNISVIWIGTNGGWTDTDGTTASPAVLVAQIQAMVDYLQTRKFIVIGLTALTAAQYATLDTAMYRAFGRKFLDLRKYILAYGLADAGITATSQDTADIAAGTIPTSLRYDATHFNDAGYTIVANQVYARMLELGYV